MNLAKNNEAQANLAMGVVVAVIAIALLVAIALIRAEGITWLFDLKYTSTGELGDVAEVLAPILAIALAIERLIEAIFDHLERSIDRVAHLGVAGSESVNWLQVELARAWTAARTISGQLGLPDKKEEDKDKELLAQLKDAEQRIDDLTGRIANLKKDPKYVSTKRVGSILIGLYLGLIVAILSDVGIFELLQISVPRFLDMLVTGFVIGTGSGPVHSLVGIIQGARDALNNLGELAALGPIKQQVKDLQGQIDGTGSGQRDSASAPPTAGGPPR